jgi:hypothetical protein
MKLLINEYTHLFISHDDLLKSEHIVIGPGLHKNDTIIKRLKNTVELPNCKILEINESKIKYLPNLPNCLIFKSYEANKLKVIPHIPKCITFNSYMNIELCEFKDKILNCVEFKCVGSSKIKHLPKLPQCEMIYCSYCDNIKIIENLPNCKMMDCSNNRQLKSIRNIPICKKIAYKNCNKLIDVPLISKIDDFVFYIEHLTH